MTTEQFVLSSPLPNSFSLNSYFSLHLLSMNSPVFFKLFSHDVFLQSIIYDTEKETWTDAILCQICCNSEPSNTWSSYFFLSTVEVRNASPHPQKSRYLVLFLHIILKHSFLCWKWSCFINFTLKMKTYLKNQSRLAWGFLFYFENASKESIKLLWVSVFLNVKNWTLLLAFIQGFVQSQPVAVVFIILTSCPVDCCSPSIDSTL